MDEQGKISFQVRESRMSLVAGILSIGFAIFIFVMWILHPKGQGGGLLLYLPLLFMAGSGIGLCIVYWNRRVAVEEMDIHYVNSLKKTKMFTLDEIGFCKLDMGGGKTTMTLYDLIGDKLCKLDFGMQGSGEFLQYLVDNKVKTELDSKRGNRQERFLPELIVKETAVCAEEIAKCTEAFYNEVEKVFREWEKRNKRFAVEWEIGFAEYTDRDLEKQAKRKRPWEWTSSLADGMEELPEDYECVLEAYLKRDGAYIVDQRGETVSMQIPYLIRCRSYQIGEKTRIRRADEKMLAEEAAQYLEMLSKEMPRHKYRMESFSIRHPLQKSAGRFGVDGKAKADGMQDIRKEIVR